MYVYHLTIKDTLWPSWWVENADVTLGFVVFCVLVAALWCCYLRWKTGYVQLEMSSEDMDVEVCVALGG